jgi:hypothetical protein
LTVILSTLVLIGTLIEIYKSLKKPNNVKDKKADLLLLKDKDNQEEKIESVVVNVKDSKTTNNGNLFTLFIISSN